jgi:hypothetical protein
MPIAMPLRRCLAALSAVALTSAAAQPARFVANTDESRVPAYQLPDLFLKQDGSRVDEAGEWPDRRREILALFADHVYGRTPDAAAWPVMRTEIISREAALFDLPAVRLQARLSFGEGEEAPSIHLLVYLPTHRPGPVPLFLGLNFAGNQSIHPDPGIFISKSWMRANAADGVEEHRATEASRGVRAHRWPIEAILARGYGLATLYCGDLAPDAFDHPQTQSFKSRFSAPDEPDTEWGSLGIWAWSLSRSLDFLASLPEVDAARIAALGHSRLGKAALWAAAQDERFAMAISNNSGCLGAALSRRQFGETVARISSTFPHWFSRRLQTYAEREAAMPVDQHMLLALVAPRPLYVASATEDLWADPQGERLAAWHASAVYRLLGRDGLPSDAAPAIEEPVGATVRYHLRRGKHDLTRYDWDRYLDFADHHFGH